MKTFSIKVGLKPLKNSGKRVPPKQIQIDQTIKYQQFYNLLTDLANRNHIKHFRLLLASRDNLALTEQKFPHYLKQLPQDVYSRYLTIQQLNQLQTVWAYNSSEQLLNSDSEQGAELIQDQDSGNSERDQQLNVNEQRQLKIQKLSTLLGQIQTNRPFREDFCIKAGSNSFFCSAEDDIQLLVALGLVQPKHTLRLLNKTQFAGLLTKCLKTFHGQT